jgi:quinol monooxygenase YgiN
VIFIVVKFKVKPDWSDKWLGLVEDFTQATRQEPGNLWFDWSRSVDDPDEFVLVEAFKDDAAGDHVIISRQLDGDGWDRMGELTI